MTIWNIVSIESGPLVTMKAVDAPPGGMFRFVDGHYVYMKLRNGSFVNLNNGDNFDATLFERDVVLLAAGTVVKIEAGRQ